MNAPRLPSDEHRTVVIGRTGAGKTVRAVHLLSTRNFNAMPWVIIDYKGDGLIRRIVKECKIKVLKVTDKPPTKPGLYILYPQPLIDDEAMEAWLMNCWKQENIGLYIDEGYALPNMGKTQAFTLILTQGRSKHVPVIILYQRPVYMNIFAVAQADFFAVFEQNIEADLKKTREFIEPAETPTGEKITVYSKLPKYHCLWYDVSNGHTSILRPAPNEADLMATFKQKLNATKPTKKGAFV